MEDVIGHIMCGEDFLLKRCMRAGLFGCDSGAPCQVNGPLCSFHDVDQSCPAGRSYPIWCEWLY